MEPMSITTCQRSTRRVSLPSRCGFATPRCRHLHKHTSLGRGLRSSGKANHLVVAATGVPNPSEIDSFVNNAIDFVKVAGDTIKQVIDLITAGEEAVEKFIPFVSSAFEKASPVARQVTKSAADISSTAITAATPVVKDAVKTALDVLSDQGVDVNDVQQKTGTVVRTASDVATPAVKSSINFLTTTEPIVLGYFALVALGLYFFGPSLLFFLTDASRGYAGDISAAGALDALINKSNTFLLDIRTSIEKERSGVLDVPGNVAGQLIEVEFALTENRKLRGQLTDPADVESRITALQIASLRRLSKSCQVLLLDASGGIAKRVAKQLKRLGFGKCFVISGGYSGWLRARLQTKPSSSVYRPEVVSPASVIGTVLGGTMQRKVPAANRKSLPPGK